MVQTEREVIEDVTVFAGNTPRGYSLQLLDALG